MHVALHHDSRKVIYRHDRYIIVNLEVLPKGPNCTRPINEVLAYFIQTHFVNHAIYMQIALIMCC